MTQTINSMTELPKVSVLMPTYNEAEYIDKTLSSVTNGSYPKEYLEIIAIDGGSSDRTVALIKEFSRTNKIAVKVIYNPKKIVSAAMNLGVTESSHEILVWLGAHADYHQDYIRNSVLTLTEEKCASVGGVIIPVGLTSMGKAIAISTSTPFGIGNAKYRYASKRQKVDTVFGGCWFKSSILTVGGFNEEWIRNQDYELNYRLRTEIGDIILDPSIKCYYFCRNSLTALASQYFQYGYWRYKTSNLHPKSFGFRQAAPIILLAGIAASLVISLFSIHLAMIIPLIYLTSNLIVSSYLAIKERSPSLLLRAPLAFTTMHLSWPVGFAKSFIDRMMGLDRALN